MNTWRNASLAVTAAAVLTLTTACGQEKGTENPNGQAVGAAAAAQPGSGGYGSDLDGGAGTANQAAAKPAGQLAVWDSKELGKVVTDSAGFTLYRFDKDTASPPKASCEGDCAKKWPVVSAGGASAAPGTDASLIGEVTRADGSKQLTIGGWPMYRYAMDTKPGDVKGQGVGGTWYASAPDGKKAGGGKGSGEESGEGSGEESGEGSGEGADYGSGEEAGGEAAELAGLSVRKDPKLGEIIVDKNGMTVYRFKKDSAWPMKSACVGECLKKWPVVAPVDKSDVEGITLKGFSTLNRPDGQKQQSVDCWPIYTFSGDKKPGDTNGQGVGGTWYVVSPQAKLVGAPK
ncbi:SCO0930 family lipoprotein [Streptomyces sp. NBC_00829]|uniref:SCO0930 family lipoprotein n=1 Tax=Streptomyces sp. NBC_00829 TaxID=2903679 RepID=UPI00386866F3|nr:SCO0930 family lipoprotein [Streptomyces sp. NBC_00829]